LLAGPQRPRPVHGRGLPPRRPVLGACVEINRVHASEPPLATAVRASILESLSRLYHQSQRPLKAIDVERELVDVHQAADQTTQTAHDLANALARLGATLIATGQFDDGREYLIRADHAFQALGSAKPGEIVEKADELVIWRRIPVVLEPIDKRLKAREKPVMFRLILLHSHFRPVYLHGAAYQSPE
jgi:hypothetical protein